MFISQGMKVGILAVILSGCYLGYTLMSVSGLSADPEYDLTIDNIPVNFDDDKTLYVDTQTNDRAFVIYNNHLKIRSSYLTFWDYNESDSHEDICYVNGSYAYAIVPAANLTLDSITEINRFVLSSSDGTVGVQCISYDSDSMTLEINSTDADASLTVRAVGLTYGHEYRVVVDGDTRSWVRVNWQNYLEYNYTGDWSNHTLSFIHIGGVTFVPNTYLNIIQVFLYLGLFVVVAKQMVLPLKDKRISDKERMNTLVKAAIYVVVGCSMISIVFHLFVGV